MSFFRSSHNYIWNTSAVLGKGATGAVYAGLHKSTGESVAVKSFNHLSHMRPYEVQKREFEVLKQVNHENIVRLLAIEEEVESQHKVLIMELCTGGSLFNILDDPINTYGLEETEYLLVMKHLAAGMKHLRDMKIMHRDLKPGNIMKFTAEDGSSIYKLTDFGAARVLEDDQQFMSLYGTEEYLHPDMYERAVLRKQAGKTFKANFDLWSIGVTLFHIATGSLPFKPYGGRKNKETMYKITTEKASGIIMGIQHSENGEIEWSKNLPKTCLLSPACQSLVTKLLAGLMECQPAKMWSFERFFETVTFILSHKVYHVFHVSSMRDIVFYVPPNESVHDLKIRLKATLGVQQESQLLLYNNNQVINLQEIQTTVNKPIILLNSDPTKIRASPIKSASAPKFPDLRVAITNTDQDAQLAKHSTSMAFSVQRIITKSVLYYDLARVTPNQVISFIQGNVTLLLEKHQACGHLYNSLKTQHQSLLSTAAKLRSLKNRLKFNEKNNESAELTSKTNELFSDLTDYWTGLSRKMTCMSDKVHELNDKWATETLAVADNAMASALTRAKNYCQKIKDSWQFLHKDKTNRILSMNEEQLHQLEKIKIENNCKKLSNLLCNTCYRCLDDVTDRLEDWYTSAQVAIVQSDCLFKELAIFMNDCDQFQQSLNSMKEIESKEWFVLLDAPLDPFLQENHMNGTSEPHASSIERPSPKVDHVPDDVSSLFLSCIESAHTLPSHLLTEILKLREAHTRLWTALEENNAVISEFETMSLDKKS